MLPKQGWEIDQSLHRLFFPLAPQVPFDNEEAFESAFQKAGLA